MGILKKFTETLRSYKFVYTIHNIFNYKSVRHNKALYKKYDIPKAPFSTISSKDFNKKPHAPNWLDKEDALKALEKNERLKKFTSSIQGQIKSWPDKGFMILEKFFSEEQVDKVNQEIDHLLNENKVDFRYNNRKIMFAFKKSKVIKDIAWDSRLTELLNFVLGRKVLLFQTINFIKGSEQRAHSDSVHMTTYPLGNLIAVWIALEDTHVSNGPLFYYPGSHKLPYVLGQDFETGNTKWKIGGNAYKKYEDKIEEVIRENRLKKVDFYAKKGDVFVWHANLIHGGNPVLDKNSTRKSMVIHYFCEDVICYHEITERPALFDSYPKSSVQVYDED